jgi:hypothetical protein
VIAYSPLSRRLSVLPLPTDQHANMTIPSTLHDASNLSSSDVLLRLQDIGTTTAVAPTTTPAHAP